MSKLPNESEVLVTSPKFRKAIIFLVEISGLFTIIGIIFSVFINTLMFNSWDMFFLEIASPEDIFMSGLYWASRFLILAGAIIFVSLLQNVILGKSRVETKRTFSFIAGAVTALIFVIAYIVEFVPNDNRKIDLVLFGSSCLLFVAFIRLNQKQNRFGKLALISAIIMTFSYFCFSSLIKFERGFSALEVTNDKKWCNSDLRVVWVGQETVILECLDQKILDRSLGRGVGSNPDQLILVPRDAVQLSFTRYTSTPGETEPLKKRRSNAQTH